MRTQANVLCEQQLDVFYISGCEHCHYGDQRSKNESFNFPNVAFSCKDQAKIVSIHQMKWLESSEYPCSM